MKNYKLLLSFVVSLCCVFYMNAQVRGLSYTINPFAERVWWGENSGLGDGYMGGLQLGLGFGENVELQANYSRSFDMNRDINRFGFTLPIETLTPFEGKKVNITRYGGDIKLNVARGAIVPYITLGTGIQSISFDTLMPAKQIYVNGGLGVKFTAGDRYTIGIQGVNNRFRFNPTSSLFTDAGKEALGINLEEFPTVMTSNYSLKASLIIYLGGRRPGKQTDIDRAYWDNFSGGFSGLSIPIEPTFSRMNFNPDLPYADTYMAGLSAGFNFGPLVGVRGFYWKALEEESFTTFDDLAMYGGEARFKLNEGRGFTPWVTLGGGNIVAGSEYSGNVDSVGIANKAFAMGGVGIDLPFTKYFKATGYVRSILTTGQDLENLAQPDQLNYSLNYGVSLNFIIGKKKKKVDVIKQSAFDEYILASEQANSDATYALKQEYEARIIELEEQKSAAILAQDQEAVEAIADEKKQAEKILKELEKPNAANIIQSGRNNFENSNSPSVVKMSPSEFQLLIQEIKRGQENNHPNSIPSSTESQNSNVSNAINDFNRDLQIKQIEKSIQDLGTELRSLKEESKDETYKVTKELQNSVDKLNDRIKALEKAADKNDRNIEILKDNQSSMDRSSNSQGLQPTSIEDVRIASMKRELENANDRIDELINKFEEDDRLANAYFGEDDDEMDYAVSNKQIIRVASTYDNSNKFLNKLKYNGMSGFAGFNVGGNATFNLGYRLHYAIDSTNFEFVPESFFGFGSPSSFGITANVFYNLGTWTKSKYINPYLGIGGGFMKVGNDENVDKLSGAYNFIAGTYLNVWAGDLYVDFTARNLFKYNQIVVGYRFPF